jgi:hypothetical protein
VQNSKILLKSHPIEIPLVSLCRDQVQKRARIVSRSQTLDLGAAFAIRRPMAGGRRQAAVGLVPQSNLSGVRLENAAPLKTASPEKIAPWKKFRGRNLHPRRQFQERDLSLIDYIC